MATFTNLFHASEVLKKLLFDKLGPTLSVKAAPPPEAIGTLEEIRISLLWIHEQPTHKNDSPNRNFDGTNTPPPASLSLFYLITTYGEGPDGDADGAHRLLGEVVRIFHDEPVIALPIAALPNNSGKGKLNVTLVPITPDLLEKLFSPLQIKHRPHALYEVWPVQLTSTLPTGAPTPVVAPDGIKLTGPAPIQAPSISRVAPRTQAEGGFLRIDGVFPQGIDSVWVAGVKIIAPELTAIDPNRSVRVKLPAGGLHPVLPGVHRLSVATGNLHSEAVDVQVSPAGSPSVDGPATLTHSQAGGDLVLTGQALGFVDFVYVWPDAGIFAPTDVKPFAASATATTITATLNGLAAGQYRISARINPDAAMAKQFTPYVVLEVVA